MSAVQDFDVKSITYRKLSVSLTKEISTWQVHSWQLYMFRQSLSFQAKPLSRKNCYLDLASRYLIPHCLRYLSLSEYYVSVSDLPPSN
jgi:hypothetical protein